MEKNHMKLNNELGFKLYLSWINYYWKQNKLNSVNYVEIIVKLLNGCEDKVELERETGISTNAGTIPGCGKRRQHLNTQLYTEINYKRGFKLLSSSNSASNKNDEKHLFWKLKLSVSSVPKCLECCWKKKKWCNAVVNTTQTQLYSCVADIKLMVSYTLHSY